MWNDGLGKGLTPEEALRFWCELFGHHYKFMGYTAAVQKGKYVFDYRYCDWKCLKCGKEITVEGEIAKDSPPQDGNLWL